MSEFKFARLTRVVWDVAQYRNATVWVNFQHVVGMSNASDGEGGGAFLKFMLEDTTVAVPTETVFGAPVPAPSPTAPLASGGCPLYVPLTRYLPPALPAFSNGFNGGFS